MVAIPFRQRLLLWFLCPIVLLVAVFAWRVNDSFVGLDFWLLGGDRGSRTGQQLRANRAEGNVTQHYASVIEVAKLASTVNNSYCGAAGEEATEISQVVAHFGRLEPYFVTEEQQERSSDASFTRTIALPFHSYDGNGTKRTMGGDEFVLTVSGWSEKDSLVWKTSAVAHDYLNGTYTALIRVPVLQNSVLHRVTLLHYYSCYQGFTRPSDTRENQDYFQLNFGPVPVEPSPTFANLVQSVGDSTSANSPFALEVTAAHTREGVMIVESLPHCPANQLGMDQLSLGIWILPSSSPDVVDICTRGAVWVPSVCRPPMVAGEELLRLDGKTTFHFFRVGDSTMPPAGANRGDKWNIGDPFSANYGGLAHHNVYIDILKHGLSESEASDVLVFGHGLHQIKNGPYNVENALESVLRMLCQLGTVFPGKMMVQAPVPIQQQLFKKIDLTDANVNLFKAMMREKLTAVDGRLADICRNIQLDVFYSAANDSGDLVSKQEALRIFKEKLQYTTELNATSDEQELLSYFRELSAQERDSIWGDRRVVYANVAHLLRPRPECYRNHDKIHALQAVDGQYLMDFGHGVLLRQFAALRGKMGA